MIPVLYKANAVDFSTFGIGVLRDCTSCEVTEERNGAFECILRYPVTGPLFKELRNERIVKAKPNDTADDQAFRIYRITTPINGEVTVYAQHLSYDLSNVAVLTWESSSTTPVHAMQRIFDNTATDHNFTCLSDEGDAKRFSVTKPQSVRACLGGTEGSILDLWGGEYEWDNFKVIRHRKRGQDTGVVIEYGKNLTELEHDCDGTEVYTDLLPYAVTTTGDGTEVAVTLPEILLPIADTDLVQRKTMIMDMSEYFGEEEAITVDGLRAHANKYLEDHPLGTLSPTLTVSFEPLWKQPRYAAVLERVSLCDTVTVRHRLLQITTKTKVITTVYDTLAEKYISISLGSARANLLENISSAESAAEDAASKIKNFKTFIDAAVKSATNQIVGQKGGYVVINTATDTGLPYELLILDQPTIEEAVNVWRWNSGGLGFSKNGYNGPYTTAITADGEIVADFITSGALTANIIKAGVLQSADGSSYWNLDTGEVHFSAYSGETDVTQIKEDIDGLKETVSTHSERFSEFQSSVDGLNSYVASLTETVETISEDMEEDQKTVLEMQAQMTELQQTVDGINIAVTEQYAGGMNLIQNSAGLNGITDDWQTTGVVSTDSSTDVRNNTASDCSFILGDTSTLQQDIVGVVTGSSYSVSVRAKKTGADYTSYVRVQYNGSKYVDLFNQTETFEWTEFSAVIPDVQDGTISIIVYNRLAELFVSDMVLTAGSTVHKWMPAPNEIYTTEVKIDRKGIEVSNPESSQRTVINNQEFSGYYNEEKIFTLNKDETVTKKTTVDGELTVGKTKFVPMPTASEGLNIVILD